MRVLIVGAAGRDFHDFNTAFRGQDVAVVAFTHTAEQNLGETRRSVELADSLVNRFEL